MPAQRLLIALLWPLPLIAGCAGDPAQVGEQVGDGWEVVLGELDGGLIGVWAADDDDVWAVGSDPDDGMGGYVYHFDGVSWTRMDTGTTGDFWWVNGADDGSVFMVGTNGLAVQYHADTGFKTIQTPDEVDLFGAFAFSADDVLTCGGNATSLTDNRQVLWHWDGQTLEEPDDFANERGNNDVLTKIFARGAEDVWVIGGPDEGLRLVDGEWKVIDMGTEDHLTTIHGNDNLLIAAGGLGRGAIVENDGSGFKQIDVGSIQPLNGISVHADGRAAASGWYGFLMLRDINGTWTGVEDLNVRDQVFHSITVTPDGTVYAAGANFFVTEVNDGLLLKGKLPEE